MDHVQSETHLSLKRATFRPMPTGSVRFLNKTGRKQQVISCSYCQAQKEEASETSFTRDIDEPIPSDLPFSSDDRNPVSLASGLSLPPETVATFFLKTVQQYKSELALVSNSNNEWIHWSFEKFYTDVVLVAESLLAHGLEAGEKVAILGPNEPLTNICIFGTILAGGIFILLNVDKIHLPELKYVMEGNSASFMICTDAKLAEEISIVWIDLCFLNYIVVTDTRYRINRKILSWSKFIRKADECQREDLERRIAQLAPNIACGIFYYIEISRKSSNTPGYGVIVSHDNITFMARNLASVVSNEKGFKKTIDKRMVTFSKFENLSALIFGCFLPVALGALTCFVGNRHQDSRLVSYLRQCRPTIFVAPSSVWTVFREQLSQRIKKTNKHHKLMINICRRAALKKFLKHHKKHGTGLPTLNISCQYYLNQLKTFLGLNEVYMFISHSLPLSPDTLEFFISLNIPICECFTSNFLCGPHSLVLPSEYVTCSIGKELPECLTRLQPVYFRNIRLKEMFVYGRHVVMGVLHTEFDVIASDRSLLTETLVHREKSQLYVRGSLKELIFLGDGKIVNYREIEDLIKSEVPFISNCMLVTRGRSLGLIISLKCVRDLVTKETSDKLSYPVRQWLQNQGSQCTSVSDVLSMCDPYIFGAIEDVILLINKITSCRITKWRIMNSDFSVLLGELDPLTLEVNRRRVKEHNTLLIDSMFSTNPKKEKLIGTYE